MRFVRLGLVGVVFALAGCHGGRTASPPQRAPVDNGALASHIDPSRPSARLLVSPVVEPVSVPRRAPLGRAMTTVFQVRSSTSCEADVAYAGGARQHLGPVAADAQGFVRWTWTPTVAGAATATVVCSGGQHGVATIRVV